MIQKDTEKAKKKERKPRTEAQMQAWFENWTLFILKGIIGHLCSLIRHANKYEVSYASRLLYLMQECEFIIDKVKEEQAKRQEEKKGKKDENLNQL